MKNQEEASIRISAQAKVIRGSKKEKKNSRRSLIRRNKMQRKINLKSARGRNVGKIRKIGKNEPKLN